MRNLSVRNTIALSPFRLETLRKKHNRDFTILETNLSTKIVPSFLIQPSESINPPTDLNKLKKIKELDEVITIYSDILKNEESTTQEKQHARSRLGKLGPVYAAMCA